MSAWQMKCTKVLIGKIPIIYGGSQKVGIKHVKSKQGLECINGELFKSYESISSNNQLGGNKVFIKAT